VKIRVTVEPRGGVGRPVSEVVEVDEAELDGFTPEQREAYLEKIAEYTANEMAPWGWAELEEGDDDA
jgi:hypothetical protein